MQPKKCERILPDKVGSYHQVDESQEDSLAVYRDRLQARMTKMTPLAILHSG